VPTFLRRAALIAGVLSEHKPAATEPPSHGPATEVRPGRPGDFRS
jgi:hypothetical protein